MHEKILKIGCKDPELVVKSLKPDIRNDKDSHTTISMTKTAKIVKATKTKKARDKNLVVITIKSKKLSHLKAIVNSYLSILAALKDLGEK